MRSAITSPVMQLISEKKMRIQVEDKSADMKQFLLSANFSLLLTSLICFFGVSYQMMQIINTYLEYRVVTEVYLEKRDMVFPPALSLCFAYVELIPWQDLGLDMTSERWLEASESERIQLAAQVQGNMTVADLFDATPDLKSLLTVGSWLRQQDTYVIERDFDKLNVTKYVKDDLVCYCVRHSNLKGDMEYKYKSYHISFGEEPGITMALSLDKEKLYRVTKSVIYVHPAHMLPRGDGDFPFNYVAGRNLSLFSGSASYVGLTYSKISLRLLPPPYQTACHQYGVMDNDMEYESSYHCVHRCTRHVTMRKYGQASFTSSFDKKRDVHIMSKYSVYKNRAKENTIDLMLSQCRKRCPGTACNQVLFTPALLSVRESERVVLLLYDMSGPEYRLFFPPLHLNHGSLRPDHECVRGLDGDFLHRHDHECGNDFNRTETFNARKNEMRSSDHVCVIVRVG